MSINKQDFILEIFNVPKGTTQAHLSIENININSWRFNSVINKDGEYIAYITILTNNPISADSLDGELVVSASNHEVMGTDIFIHTKEVFEEQLTNIVEAHALEGVNHHDKIKWLSDLLGYKMDALYDLILLDNECPLYTEEMISKYWKHIESLEDNGDKELHHDVNSDICVMESVTLPTEKLYLAYHKKGSEEAQSYIDARDNMDSYYPINRA
jgi:hypothetical protein